MQYKNKFFSLVFCATLVIIGDYFYSHTLNSQKEQQIENAYLQSKRQLTRAAAKSAVSSADHTENKDNETSQIGIVAGQQTHVDSLSSFSAVEDLKKEQPQKIQRNSKAVSPQLSQQQVSNVTLYTVP